MSDIKAALTPEEWNSRRVKISATESIRRKSEGAEARIVLSGAIPAVGPTEISTTRLHALAALALHGQPFGLTREEHAALRRALDSAERWVANTGTSSAAADMADVETGRAVADKIEALLPPEAK